MQNQAAMRDARAMTDKSKAIESAIAQIEKQFGKGAIMKLGEASQRMAVDTIPTGSIALDIALGVGGVAQRGADASVVGDATVLERDVQVGAHQHPLALDGQVANGPHATFWIRSTSRHE